MCRLYGFRATEATKVECTLVHAQNALLVQSRRDRSGERHADGWGLATYDDGVPRVERKPLAAFADEHFGRAAARAYSQTVIAHVRAATVGSPSLENTHPFCDGRWVFAHNGTLRGFAEVRRHLLDEMSDAHRAAIRGETDSEHVFRLLLSALELSPGVPPLEVLRNAIVRLVGWARAAGTAVGLGLNFLWTDGGSVYGSRLGRPLWYVQREGVLDCEVCGFGHVRHHPGSTYRAFVVASEPITHEEWREVPEGSIFRIGEDAVGHFEALDGVFDGPPGSWRGRRLPVRPSAH